MTLLSEKMEEMFIFWGVEHEDHKRLLSFLIDTQSDLERFMGEYYDGNILSNMMGYQRYRREKYRINLKSFQDMFETNRLGATRRLFQEPLDESDMLLLDKYNTSYEDLYMRLQSNPHTNYLDVARHKPCEVKDYSDNFLIIY